MDIGRKLANYYEQAAAVHSFSGVILSAAEGSIEYLQAYGKANREHDVPCRTDTRFLIASISKPVTALAILLLGEQGRLDITDSVRRYLPELIAEDSITLHQLLTHTSGLPDFERLPQFFEKTGKIAHCKEEMLRLVQGLPLDFTPGTGWSYSSTGYNALGLIIDRAAGMSYEEFVGRHLLKPLGMANTGFADSERIVPDLASGYSRQEGDIVRAASFAIENFRGSGGMFAATEDLLKLDKSLSEHTVVSRKSLERMQTRHAFAKKRYYGYGLSVFEQSRGHGGSLPGCSCTYRKYPDHKRTVIILGNHDFANAGEILKGAEAIITEN